MKFLKKENSLRFQNGAITAFEYPLNDLDINCAVVELTGRHPAVDFLINEKCKELVYVSKGSGTLNTESQSISLEEGDMVIIEPQEKYFWDGNFTLIAPCTPPWSPEQNKNVK